MCSQSSFSSSFIKQQQQQTSLDAIKSRRSSTGYISRCLLVLLRKGQKSLSLSSSGSGFLARWPGLLGEISMLSSSISSSSSSSSRSISLSPKSSCRKVNRVPDQFGSQGEGTLPAQGCRMALPVDAGSLPPLHPVYHTPGCSDCYRSTFGPALGSNGRSCKRFCSSSGCCAAGLPK